ncbi:MAG: hypothetical protein DME97_05600 [Verrucomicrobia bacterium]|nr:MAG: hypothetical protein DME97_05600 [Verrucomicrobiota bacterium]
MIWSMVRLSRPSAADPLPLSARASACILEDNACIGIPSMGSSRGGGQLNNFVSAPDDAQFLIRMAEPEDAVIVAWHRARMFQDMGEIPAAMFDDFSAASRAWTERALISGEYIGWFAFPKSQPDLIVAGAGVQLRQVPPHPCRPAKNDIFAKGRHAIVLNVFTEPEWRKRGVAMLLMNEIVSWAKDEKVDQLVLHASAQARSLYERMGFNPTNEMRFSGEL